MIIIYVCRGLQGNMHGPDLIFSVNVHASGLNKLSYASTAAARVKRQLTCLTFDARVERPPLGTFGTRFERSIGAQAPCTR